MFNGRSFPNSAAEVTKLLELPDQLGFFMEEA